MALDAAIPSVITALEDDPFYRAITVAHGNDRRHREALAQYFDYSIQEGRAFGRCVHLEDPAIGVAVWLLPQPADVRSRAAEKKMIFLEEVLGAEGSANYARIVEFMHTRTAKYVPDSAWYLSIVAVDPAAQGRGLGRKLLEPTIAEADRAAIPCFLETFTPRNIPFYERIGFSVVARIAEPTTGADYAVMLRQATRRL